MQYNEDSPVRDQLIAVTSLPEEMTIVFEKRDGTMRVMRCTRNLAHIPHEMWPTGGKVEAGSIFKEVKTDAAITAFDLEKQAWRAFIPSKVYSVTVNGVVVWARQEQ